MNNQDLINQLSQTIGKRNVLTNKRSTRRFLTGFRSGSGEAIAVVRPNTLVEMWQALGLCVKAGKAVIFQAANTGLTGGSTPDGHYDRDIVLINTQRIRTIHTLNQGQQIVALPGASLFELEKILQPINRQPHSVIGSSCIGASVIGGVCNNSGGSLVERGPAYTEMSLFAQVTAAGEIELINHLGIELGNTPEQILSNVEAGNFDQYQQMSAANASDTKYPNIVREVEASTPARFNADKRCLHESSGCGGKLAVFAVRLDTFPTNKLSKTFYIGTNDPHDLTAIRHRILKGFKALPVSAEYMHRDCFNISEKYGKDTVVMIDLLGTDKLPIFFAIKGAIDSRLNRLPLFHGFTDKFMQVLSSLWPRILPKRLYDYRNKFEHHLILKMADGGIAEAQQLLPSLLNKNDASYFECTPKEAQMASLNRFAAAGAAIRYAAVHKDEVEDVLALDIALPRNSVDWFEKLPEEISSKLHHSLYYGHFMCHVLHQDYIVKKNQDSTAIKQAMLQLLDQRGAEYPAEHNVGHQYVAKPDLAAFYKSIDPSNTLNPGIGKMSKRKDYAPSRTE
ncbi:D-lactate dehydrogenase [Maritalea porphyrae]|uniref:D-lactate dehydrogenase n=1 Tax=Maritalea porphyrae TaxID=880732 RepID=UPI002F354AD5